MEEGISANNEMTKILSNGDWYYELSATSLYETEVENIIAQNSKVLFPEFQLVQFKKTVYSEEGSARADFALIDSLYRKWWVVEVEMRDHSLDIHVVPQIRILSRANYNEEEALYLCQKSSLLKKLELTNLVTNVSPRVLIIANSVNNNWLEPIKGLDADILAIEIYRSDKNKHLLRVHGNLPTVNFSFISKCSFLPYLPNFLSLQTPNKLLEIDNSHHKVLYSGKYSIWEYVVISQKSYLVPTSANPLSQGLDYELIQTEDGQLILRDAT